MLRRIPRSCALLAACTLVLGCSEPTLPDVPASNNYEDLVTFFEAWRAFQAPPLRHGVPDYSPTAMAAQHRALATYQQRLAAFDTVGWPIAHQIDYHLVRAEMNGLDFDHRVRKPWVNNPAFYTMVYPYQTDIPAREGPVVAGAIELWSYPTPYSEEHLAALQAQFATIAPLLEQAQANLIGNTRDLWHAGIRRIQQQSADLAAFAERIADAHPDLAKTVQEAQAATDRFVGWLEHKAPSKTGPSGVGKEHYTWYLQQVHLIPYTWEEQVTLMRRELARSLAALKLEEHRNRDLPPLTTIEDAATYDQFVNAAVDRYMAFLAEADILTVQGYMDAALRARMGQFSPAVAGRRPFFAEVNYRDPLVMRTHHFHWFDLAQMAESPHESPIRRVPLLYNIFDGRAEGLATGMEEMMLHAGLFDDRPRARELVWILLAQRAARALGGLYLHSNDFTMAEAIAFASQWTPRGWLPADGRTVWGEQHLYLQQPGYGTSYVMGKIEIEHLIAEVALQQGEAFSVKNFFDTFTAAGVIPTALIRWEMTGHSDQITQLAAPR